MLLVQVQILLAADKVLSVYLLQWNGLKLISGSWDNAYVLALAFVIAERALAFYFLKQKEKWRKEEEEEKEVFNLLQEASPTNLNGV